MPKRTIVIASENKKAVEYITDYFSDTESIPTVIRSKSDLPVLSSLKPDVIFFQGDWLDQRASSRLNEFKAQNPNIKYFSLGNPSSDGMSWDGKLELPIDERMFRKILLGKISLPDPIKLLITDDEVEIIEVLKDYFEVRKDPPFQVRTALNGLEAFKLVEEDQPHCIILDIKMPVRTGVECYRDLCRSGHRIPTIIFIDSTAADDILEIRKWGTPVFLEKGGPSSSMPDVLALVKKLVAFS